MNYVDQQKPKKEQLTHFSKEYKELCVNIRRPKKVSKDKVYEVTQVKQSSQTIKI